MATSAKCGNKQREKKHPQTSPKRSGQVSKKKCSLVKKGSPKMLSKKSSKKINLKSEYVALEYKHFHNIGSRKAAEQIITYDESVPIYHSQISTDCNGNRISLSPEDPKRNLCNNNMCQNLKCLSTMTKIKTSPKCSQKIADLKKAKLKMISDNVNKKVKTKTKGKQCKPILPSRREASLNARAKLNILYHESDIIRGLDLIDTSEDETLSAIAKSLATNNDKKAAKNTKVLSPSKSLLSKSSPEKKKISEKEKGVKKLTKPKTPKSSNVEVKKSKEKGSNNSPLKSSPMKLSPSKSSPSKSSPSKSSSTKSAPSKLSLSKSSPLKLSSLKSSPLKLSSSKLASNEKAKKVKSQKPKKRASESDLDWDMSGPKYARRMASLNAEAIMAVNWTSSVPSNTQKAARTEVLEAARTQVYVSPKKEAGRWVEGRGGEVAKSVQNSNLIAWNDRDVICDGPVTMVRDYPHMTNMDPLQLNNNNIPTIDIAPSLEPPICHSYQSPIHINVEDCGPFGGSHNNPPHIANPLPRYPYPTGHSGVTSGQCQSYTLGGLGSLSNVQMMPFHQTYNSAFTVPCNHAINVPCNHGNACSLATPYYGYVHNNYYGGGSSLLQPLTEAPCLLPRTLPVQCPQGEVKVLIHNPHSTDHPFLRQSENPSVSGPVKLEAITPTILSSPKPRDTGTTVAFPLTKPVLVQETLCHQKSQTPKLIPEQVKKDGPAVKKIKKKSDSETKTKKPKKIKNPDSIKPSENDKVKKKDSKIKKKKTEKDEQKRKDKKTEKKKKALDKSIVKKHVPKLPSPKLKLPETNVTVTKNNVTKETVTKENVTKEKSKKVTTENVSKEIVTKENVSKENVSKENVIKESMAKENSKREEAPKCPKKCEVVLIKADSLLKKDKPFAKKDESGGKIKRRRNSHGWTWIGTPENKKVFSPSTLGAVDRPCYSAMKHVDGDVIHTADCVLLCAGPRRSDVPYVAKVTNLWENMEDGEMMLSLLWYYRPEHTESGRRPNHMDVEVFASKHRDENSVACIEDKCYVLTYNEYCRYRANQKFVDDGCYHRVKVAPEQEGDYPRSSLLPPLNADPECVLLCRQVYDFRQKRILKNPS